MKLLTLLICHSDIICWCVTFLTSDTSAALSVHVTPVLDTRLLILLMVNAYLSYGISVRDNISSENKI